MDAVLIRSILAGEADGKQVLVKGWLQNKRSSGGIIFLIVRDGSGIIQSTIRKGGVEDRIFEEFLSARIESTVELEGVVRPDARAPGGRELQVGSGRIEYPALDEFPIAKKFHGPEFLLDERHLFVRSDRMRAVLRIRAVILSAARSWFDSHGFLEVQVPILTSAAVEGGATLFEVKYFDEKAFLTQSWQLYAEALIASVGRIYTVAPSFRAEKSRTRRHLTEYWHVEAEAPWCDMEGIIRVEEQMLSYILDQLIVRCADELGQFERKLEDLRRVMPPFPRITYDEAFRMMGGENSGIKWGDEVTMSVDMLAPEGYGEITGGGQRIEEYDALVGRMKEEGLDPKSYGWYLDLRKYGSVPHSGFGMGLERLVSWVCKLDHIRDAIAFPRLINRVYP